MATLIQAHDNKNNNSAPPDFPDAVPAILSGLFRCAFTNSAIILATRETVSFDLRQGGGVGGGREGGIAYLSNLTRSTLVPDIPRSSTHPSLSSSSSYSHRSYYSSPFPKSRLFESTRTPHTSQIHVIRTQTSLLHSLTLPFSPERSLFSSYSRAKTKFSTRLSYT